MAKFAIVYVKSANAMIEFKMSLGYITHVLNLINIVLYDFI